MKDHTLQDDSSMAKNAIDALDYAPIIEVLCRSEPDGPGWSPAKAANAVEEYRRFLKLNALFPDERIVPTRLVDEVWHTHILDTRKYARDCEAVFGYFLHHFPYFGQRGDAHLRDSAFDTTQALYEKEFGKANMASKAAGCDAGDIRAAGCDAGDIRAAGCDAGDIRA